MFLSIIIPVYNAEKYLAECLDSCLDQDIPQDDYEIICVNDGSGDGSAAILDAYAAAHPNIRVLHKENAGVSEARNDGSDLAQGDYIWFVDADDFIAGKILGSLRELALASSCDRLTFPSYGFRDQLTPEEQQQLQQGTLNPCFDHGDNVVWTCLFRRDALIRSGVRFISKLKSTIDNTNLVYGEDTLFVYQFKKHDPVQAAFTAKPVYFYRQNPGSVTMDFSENALRARMNAYIQMAVFIKADYDAACRSGGRPSVETADRLMVLLRKALEIVAMLPRDRFREAVDQMRSQQLFPCRQPPECTYTWQQCANEPSGTGKLRNIFRYYSIHPVGLFLAAMPYRLHRVKVRLSRFLRKNPLSRGLLDLKNKLLRR